MSHAESISASRKLIRFRNKLGMMQGKDYE